MAQSSHQLLTSVLKDVSRSFYLTLRVLPAKIRPQIGIAYLLARTTDTVADTELVPLEQRLQALQELAERISGRSQNPLDFGELAKQQASPAECVLLENCEAILGLLQTLAGSDLERVRQVLDTITSGQELDLRRFADASPEHIVALNTNAELDDYTYRVAGCVGEFWTKMCRRHLFPEAPLDEARWLANGVRFGKGLQLVNILRDLPVDLRHGRCYLPAESLATFGLKPPDLLQPGNESRFRPLYDTYLARAESHLLAGWDYTNILPRRHVRVRLACAWPILIGLQTLKLLRTANVLDPRKRVKISRRQVRQVICRSILYYPLSGMWRGLAPAESSLRDGRVLRAPPL